MSVWVNVYDSRRRREELTYRLKIWAVLSAAAVMSVLVPWLVVGFDLLPDVAIAMLGWGIFATIGSAIAAISMLIAAVDPSNGFLTIRNGNGTWGTDWAKCIKLLSWATTPMIFGMMLIAFSVQ